MIMFVTGPSGVGKTDVCFALLAAVESSVYLDSDWLSAKNPIDPLSEERIEELYDLLRLNIGYHVKKGVEIYFVALYQEAALHFPRFAGSFLSVDTAVLTVLLTASRGAMESRIMARDRIQEQKSDELRNLSRELERTSELARRATFDINIDTSEMSSYQVAGQLIDQSRLALR